MTSPRHHLLAIATALALASLVSCDPGDDTSTRTSAPLTPEFTAPSTSSTSVVTPPDGDGGIDTMVGADTSPKTGPSATSGTALLTAVRAARHEGFDRVVFEFRNGTPGWDVRYVDKPVLADASGEEVPVAGQYVLRVRMEPASAVDLNAPGGNRVEETYTGPRRFTPATPEIAEVVDLGDFEAVLTWAVGLQDHVDFRAFTLASPPRLVIDVRNH